MRFLFLISIDFSLQITEQFSAQKMILYYRITLQSNVILRDWYLSIAVHGLDSQQRDKHSRDTGFSKGGIPKFFDPQRGDTPGMEIFPTRGYFALKNANFIILL